MKTYDERLAEVEAEWAEFELLHVQMKAKMAKVLRDRPCDFFFKYGDRVWIQRRRPDGGRAGFGWSKLPPDHKSVLTFKTRESARQYLVYLEHLKKIKGIQIEERPRGETS